MCDKMLWELVRDTIHKTVFAYTTECLLYSRQKYVNTAEIAGRDFVSVSVE